MNNSLGTNLIVNMLSLKVIVVVMCIILTKFDLSFGLECYVCENQEDNESKCVSTIKTCQPEEDVCLTEVSWGSRPYWVQGAQKQYYISKRCANNAKCKRQREAYMKYCSHIWYEDWKCSECCKGDKCNYYIISAGYGKSASYALLPITLALTWHRYLALS